MALKPPFPWFGGKREVAAEVWGRLGDVTHYIEPFFGMGAVLISRPRHAGIETINDKDGFITNFWRAVKYDPVKLASYHRTPLFESELHAWHRWLSPQRVRLTESLEMDPAFFDVEVAGYWSWGASVWLYSGWCRGDCVVYRQRMHSRHRPPSHDLIMALHDRLVGVRVMAGDWSRSVTEPMLSKGLVGIFIDPPYTSLSKRKLGHYAIDSLSVGRDAFDFAVAAGERKNIRIGFCGYIGEYDFPSTWEVFHWKRNSAAASASKECVWFSPHCLRPLDLLCSKQEQT